MKIECDHCHNRITIPGDNISDNIELKPCHKCGENSWTLCETSKLMMCNDCGNLISKRAKFCPHCGWTKDSGIPAKVVRFDPEFQDYVKLIIYFFCASIVVAVLAFLLFMVIYTVKFAK